MKVVLSNGKQCGKPPASRTQTRYTPSGSWVACLPYWAGRAHSPNIARRQSSQSSASVRPFATTSRHMIIVSRRKYTVSPSRLVITVSSPSHHRLASSAVVAGHTRTHAHTYTRTLGHRTSHRQDWRTHTHRNMTGSNPLYCTSVLGPLAPLFHRPQPRALGAQIPTARTTAAAAPKHAPEEFEK